MSLENAPLRGDLGTYVRSALGVRDIDQLELLGWEPVGSGLNSFVYAIHSFGGSLYAGGAFTFEGDFSTALDRIARWTGTEWVSVGASGGLNGVVNTMTTYNSELYVGGEFTQNIATTLMRRVAVYNGTEFEEVGSGFNDDVKNLTVFSLELYAVGEFTANGNGTNMDYVAKFNGTDWEEVGTGFNSFAYKLYVFDNELYACGAFTQNGNGDTLDYVAKFNGSDWEAVGSGFNAAVNSFATLDDELYVVGNFTQNGNGDNMKRIAKLGDSDWEAVFDQDLNNSFIYDIAVFKGVIYLGGSFFDVGGDPDLDYVVKNDGDTWVAVGTGLNNDVYTFGTHARRLYAGGNFTTNGDSDSMIRIAKWTGEPQ